MTVIFTLLFLAALVGVFKPYINGLNRKHFGIAAAVSFILIGVTAPAPSPNAPGSPEEVASPPASVPEAKIQSSVSEPVSNWTYSADKDEMRGTTSHFASVRSENEVDMDFPYGVVRGELWVRKRPEDGLNVAFRVDKGQVLCRSFGDSYVSIKFDDGPIQKFSCTDSSDGSSETAFIENAQRALKGISTAKKTVVEAEFYQQGRQQFIFNTANLKWEN